MSVHLSLLISQLLENVGFSEEMRKYRAEGYRKYSYVKSLNPTSKTLEVISGSKAEGTSTYQQDSDIDYLFIIKGVIAVETNEEQICQSSKNFMLRMDYENAPPGYCRVHLLKEPTLNILDILTLSEFQLLERILGLCNAVDLSNCTVRHRKGIPLVSSRYFVNRFRVDLRTEHIPTVSGPALSVHNRNEFSKDAVQAIQCSGRPSPINPWFARKRKFGWPGQELIKKVSETNYFIVPVGMTGSTEKYLEWRLSFNMAEQLLITSFNLAQYQVYVLAKMLFKNTVGKTFPDCISSYMIKTVMFWAIENTKSEFWKRGNIIQCLRFFLLGMRNCVESERCPNYFIPENNLLYRKLTWEEKTGIYHLLTELLNEDGACVLRCPELKEQLWPLGALPRQISANIKNATRDKVDIKLDLIYSMNQLCRTLIGYFEYMDWKTARECFAHIILSASCIKSDEREITKYIFNRLVSKYMFHELVRSPDRGRNRQVYSSVIASLSELHRNRNVEAMWGKVTFAHALFILGKNIEAYRANSYALLGLKHFKHRCSLRKSFVDGNYFPLLHTVLQNDQVSFVKVSKLYSMWDVVYLPSEEAGLPMALQYEVHKRGDGIPSKVILDGDFLAFYFQYLCSKEIKRCDMTSAALATMARVLREEGFLEYREVALRIYVHCLIQEERYLEAADFIRSFMPSIAMRNESINIAIWYLGMLFTKLLSLC